MGWNLSRGSNRTQMMNGFHLLKNILQVIQDRRICADGSEAAEAQAQPALTGIVSFLVITSSFV